jgi:hypothetical protein
MPMPMPMPMSIMSVSMRVAVLEPVQGYLHLSVCHWGRYSVRTSLAHW